MGKYTDSPTWSDLTPLPTSDGPTPHPLAAIAYPPPYEETMSYLRALMSTNEHTPRVLALTEDLIDTNPAHYTVWLYRAKTLLVLGERGRMEGELEWLNETALAHQKNYQIWHHRVMVVDWLGGVYAGGEGEGKGEKVRGLVEGERAFMKVMFERDGKNYHVWSYRQWLVRRFGLWGRGGGELEFVEGLIEVDVRNNSAWNHRWFVVNGSGDGRGVEDAEVREREVEVAQTAIRKTPANPSPWNYLRGIVRKTGHVDGLREFAEEFANVDQPDTIKSSQALDFLVDLLAQDEDKQKAGQALDLLTTKFDPIRKNYWEYRKQQLGLPVATA